jgi:hypothetical protein
VVAFTLGVERIIPTGRYYYRRGTRVDVASAAVACGGRGKVGSAHALLMYSLPKNIVLSVSQFRCVEKISDAVLSQV